MKTCIIFGFVFIVMMTVVAILLGSFGASVLFTALGIDWTLRLVAAIVVSTFIAGWLS
jgi:hypothetical protein